MIYHILKAFHLRYASDQRPQRSRNVVSSHWPNICSERTPRTGWPATNGVSVQTGDWTDTSAKPVGTQKRNNMGPCNQLLLLLFLFHVLYFFSAKSSFWHAWDGFTLIWGPFLVLVCLGDAAMTALWLCVLPWNGTKNTTDGTKNTTERHLIRTGVHVVHAVLCEVWGSQRRLWGRWLVGPKRCLWYFDWGQYWGPLIAGPQMCLKDIQYIDSDELHADKCQHISGDVTPNQIVRHDTKTTFLLSLVASFFCGL